MTSRRSDFNLAAFAMPTPLSATVGDFGNAPLGLLRNPTISEWDVTVERRFPIKGMHGKGVRVQVQAYNIFNQVEFLGMNTGLTFTGANNVQSSNNAGNLNTNAGVLNPRQIGLTIRFDF